MIEKFLDDVLMFDILKIIFEYNEKSKLAEDYKIICNNVKNDIHYFGDDKYFYYDTEIYIKFFDNRKILTPFNVTKMISRNYIN